MTEGIEGVHGQTLQRDDLGSFMGGTAASVSLAANCSGTSASTKSGRLAAGPYPFPSLLAAAAPMAREDWRAGAVILRIAAMPSSAADHLGRVERHEPAAQRVLSQI